MKTIIIGNDRTSVGELIGKGGEGHVYAIQGRPGLAVKIYDSSLRARREEKVRAMVSEGLATTTDLVAYPGDVVTARDGTFIGFAMRLVTGYRPIHELYSPKSRQRHFPKADYRFVVQAALNVARAVGSVHQMGCVIGDVNHSGVLVAEDATVALIDADSFQFRRGGRVFPCVVGVPEFTPPELHGRNLASVERTTSHDNFGLAVAIFQLLFMGRHPYAGTYLGQYISMGDSIAQHRFAYSLHRQSETGTRPPPGALTLDLFPDATVTVFERAFGVYPAARPSASDWITALTRLRDSLTRCNANKMHYHPVHANGCVWCGLTASSGFDMFPDLASGPSYSIPTDSHGIEQAIRELQAYSFPTAADILSHTAPAHGPSIALKEARSNQLVRQLTGWLMIAGAAGGLWLAPRLMLIWIGLGGLGLSLVSNRTVDARPFVKAFKDADELVQRELDSYVRRSGLLEALKLRSDLSSVIAAYNGHDAALARELTQLAATREARQRTAYLDQFSIRGADIPGIGPAKTAALMSFGIETAADVDSSAASRVPGFGSVLTSKLMAWRRTHELGFRYTRTPNAQDTAEERALRSSYGAEKAKLDATIRGGVGKLRESSDRFHALSGGAVRDRPLTRALEARAQAEFDLKALGAFVPASTVRLATPSTQGAPQPHPTPNPIKPMPGRSATTNRAPLCPRCGSPMRRRSGRFGSFWGCSRYPQCKGTRNG